MLIFEAGMHHGPL